MIFMWMGKTAVRWASSGYEYSNHPSGIERVDVEVDEAEHSSTMSEGKVRIFISPRMTRKDAPLKIAQAEHVGDDDAVRVSWLETKNGKTERVMQALLVKDIPFEAWVAMLEDDENMFGGALSLEDRESALSVMKLHRQLEVPRGLLESGPVSVVEAVLPYIEDSEAHAKVAEQIKKYHTKNQAEMHQQAVEKADEWLAFEQELAESLATETATYDIRRFIARLQHQWGEDDLAVISRHQRDNTAYEMSRELAAVLESAQQNLLSGRAALLADEEHVLKQVKNPELLRQMQDAERLMTLARQQGMDYLALQARQDRMVVRHNVKANGGGCPGKNKTEFSDGDSPENGLGTALDTPGEGPEAGNDDKEAWSWKDGVCRVESCATRPGKTKVGPCSICKSCQEEFDAGRDPTLNEPKVSAEKTEKVAGTITWFVIGEEKQRRNAEDKTAYELAA